MSYRLLLVRHGRPELNSAYSSITSRFADYDLAQIDPSYPPPQHLLLQTATVNKWFCSTLPRATSSLAMLKPTYPPILSDLFREAALPHKEKPAFCPLKIWFLWLRGRWMQGALHANESYLACQERAQKAVDFILSRLNDNEHAGVMGHGFFNFMLAQELKKRAWQHNASTYGYWSLRIMNYHV